MSEDWLIRSDRAPELTDIVSALAGAVPALSLRADASETAVVVVDRHNRPCAWICQSRRVHAPRTHARLLPLDGPDGHPVWTEVTGATDTTTPPFTSAYDLIRTIASALATELAGTAVRLSAATPPTASSDEATDAASSSTTAEEGAHPEPPTPPDQAGQDDRRAADIPVDVVTDELAVLVQSRPVLTLSPWLFQAHRWASDRGLQFVVLTPAGTTLTPQLHGYLQTSDAAWVVDGGSTLYLGLTGHQVEWTAGSFRVQQRIDPTFTPEAGDPWAMVIQAETTLPFAEDTLIGEFSAGVMRAAGLEGPDGAGLLDPPEEAFDPRLLTRFARMVSPDPARLLIASEQADGVIEVVPQPIGAVERLTLLADGGAGPLTDSAADAFVDGLLSSGAQIAMLGYRRSAPGRLVPARFTGPTVPRVALFSRTRFPTLRDEEARRLAGPGGRLVREPAAALTVSYDLSPRGAEVPAEDNPAVRWSALVDSLAHHDAHAQAAQQQDEPKP